MEFFKRKLDDYSTNINPINNYMKQAIEFVRVRKGVSLEVARSLVKDVISNHSPVDPMVTYIDREDNGDRCTTTTKLTDYIKDTVKNGDIITPSLTVYDHPTKNRSLHADFLKINITRRKKHKALAFKAYQKGDTDGYVQNDVLQKVMKIFNNSLSGAYASKSTVLYNPSQHYTLTSITRSVASIGNSVSESVIAGNKCLYTPDAVMNYITAIITTVNLNTIASAVSEYNLVYPSTDNIMDMLQYSTDRYWTNPEKIIAIREYVDTLDKYQRAAVMYVNDLYHLRMYNNTCVTDFVGTLAAKGSGTIQYPLKALKIDTEGVNNLVHHICMDDIRGMDINYDELATTNPKLLMLLGVTADNIYRVLHKYKLLLKAFFVTDILPIDIANIKDCYRDVIVLSDTDSTCGSYDNWTTWYFGHDRFTSEAVALSAAVMTINTQVIDHNIRVFAKNMNIDNDRVGLLKMKNEYFWSAFVTANVSKHYYANTWIQEGNVYRAAKLELKGVHLIASAGNQDIVSKAHADMVTMLESIEQGKPIRAIEVITKVADMERGLLDSITKGDISIFKLDKIKEPTAYKLDDKSKTPYFHHVLWNEVFGDKYGSPGDPTYMTVKIPTKLKSRKSLNDYITTIEDTDIRDKLDKLLKANGKEALGTYRVPLSIAGGKGIPIEMMQAVDKQRMVLDNMNIYYIHLETMGIYRKPNLLFSEMGY